MHSLGVCFLFVGGYLCENYFFFLPYFWLFSAITHSPKAFFSDDDDETRILNNYGYIVGTLNTTEWLNYYDQDDPTSMYWQPHGLENSANYGRFLHYYFWLNVGNDVYKCVIDLKHADEYESPYRVITLNEDNEEFYEGIFDATETWHSITALANGYDPDEGAIDYYRHPGILLDMADDLTWQPTINNTDSAMFPIDQSYSPVWNDNPWKKLSVIRTPNDTNIYHYSAPAFDALFNNVSKIYVFGERFINNQGYGMHNIHQYQGDRAGTTYAYSDGTFQDGAVIFEYTDGSRKLLMVKIGDHYHNNQFVSGQIDFSYDNASSTNYSGEAAPFTYLTISYTPLFDGNHAVYGPYTATEIEAITEGDYAITISDSDISIAFGYFTSSSGVMITEANHSNSNVEYIRSAPLLWKRYTFPRPLAPANNTYYLHVFHHFGSMGETFPIHLRYR